MKRISMLIVSGGVAACGLTLTSCAPWSTYPPIEAKMAQSVTRETFEPVPTVMAIALNYAREKYAGGRETAINLPEGTNAAAYDKVIKKLGWGRPLMIPGDDALHVTEVRTRGFNGQVDLIFRRSSGLHQMVTITMGRGAFDHYKVTGTRLWQLRNLAAPGPNYAPPPFKETHPATETEPATDAAPTTEVTPVLRTNDAVSQVTDSAPQK